MRWINRYNRWLEKHWATPTYSGWVLISLTASFWLAAANTLAGWLYVLSGTCLALLCLSAYLPTRLLKKISIQRSAIHPISVGESLTMTVVLERPPSPGSLLLQCQDLLPATFETSSRWQTLEWSADSHYRWTYSAQPQKRGQYNWKALHLKTGAPLGLFSSLRTRHSAISALVYPEIIPLSHCPILDEFTAIQASLPDQQHSQQLGQDGTTRSIRPYRHGDTRRLIHWRSSAKFNELRTRELEVIAGESPVIIALNSGDRWLPEAFESAVIAATSLFHYAQQQGISVQLWTAASGLQRLELDVLETLALVNPAEADEHPIPIVPVLWLTESMQNNAHLPQGSRILKWQPASNEGPTSPSINLEIDWTQDLANQLQKTSVIHSS